MSASRFLRRSVIPQFRGLTRGGGGGGPMMPPFARQAPPNRKLPEEKELVWDDQVAPETCIDFDAPNVDANEALRHFIYGILFFVSVRQLIAWYDPQAKCSVAPRETVIPYDYKYEMGFKGASLDGGDEEEEEEE